MNDTLIIYFSKSGRTKAIAEQIKKEINAGTYEIKTSKKYPATYRFSNNTTSTARKFTRSARAAAVIATRQRIRSVNYVRVQMFMTA